MDEKTSFKALRGELISYHHNTLILDDFSNKVDGCCNTIFISPETYIHRYFKYPVTRILLRG